ncbi:UNVERIFIED_CONTAM: hypothetical protein FKN15_040988 [Acipenser sinensis]
MPSPKDNSGFQYDTKPGGKSTRSKAKSFLKRMESLRLKSSPSKKKKVTSKLVISGPVLREGIDEDKLRSLNCVEISRLNGHHSSLLRNRSISYATQVNSSSQSEAGSSTVSTPSPVTRVRSQSTAYNNSKRGGMYLEGFDPFSQLQLQQQEQLLPASHDVAERNLRNQKEAAEEDMIFFIPEGHKPGTFPKALCNTSPRCRLRRESRDFSSKDSCCGGQNRRNSASSMDSRLSIYDNVPCSLFLDGEEEEAPYPKLDDILHHVRGLQRFVNEWSEQACEEGDSDSALDSVSPCPSSPLQNHLEEVENESDLDSTGNSLHEQEEVVCSRERRDSGVGASLTRSNRAVPKFMKRIKVPDYKDRNVFGVPLQVNVQRTGQPLPQCIQQAMRYLRSQCLDQVGLFRKSGVKSRIQALRQMNESCTDSISYEEQSAFDVADMVKQYFRDLPEPLLTSKLSETFLQIYQYVPKDQQLQAIKAAILLLPDENREVLQTLLYFLSDVTAAVKENQMTNNNLAVCLAPSLFHLNTLKRETSSPRTWTTDLPKRACALVATSVDHGVAPLMGVRVNVLTCRYLIEPCGSAKSKLSYISRIDCRGRIPEWYNKMFGQLCAAEVVRIRDSFNSPPLEK